MTPAFDYDPVVTELCERVLVTVMGNAGFWGQHLYLVGGLVPRYLYGSTTHVQTGHVGSRDIDIAVILVVDDPSSKKYETLERNLRDGGFSQAPLEDDPDFRWRRDVDGVSVELEFLCDTDQVAPGRNFKPRAGSGSRFQALNVRGCRLVETDHSVVDLSAERLDGGGKSTAKVRVAGLLPFVVLKILAFVDRHNDKDAYDIVWSLLNHPDGPSGAGRQMAKSAVARDPFVLEALGVLAARFADAGNDAPISYAVFEGAAGTPDEQTLLRNVAVESVRLALSAYREVNLGSS